MGPSMTAGFVFELSEDYERTRPARERRMKVYSMVLAAAKHHIRAPPHLFMVSEKDDPHVNVLVADDVCQGLVCGAAIPEVRLVTRQLLEECLGIRAVACALNIKQEGQSNDASLAVCLGYLLI